MQAHRVIEGQCDAAFRAVADRFEASIAGGIERGAAVTVFLEGRAVVDLWGGTADADGVRTWQRDTVVNVFSVTKAMTALCAHLLVARELLDLEAPVVRYWPEFAAAGKQGVTVAQLLDHSAGLPALRATLPAGSLYDWAAMVGALAAEEPWWEPGTRHGYHAVTFGFLVGEVLRRVTGHSMRALVRDLLAVPLGADLHIGLPESLADRAAYLPPVEPPPATQADHPFLRAMANPASLTARAFTNPAGPAEPGGINGPGWRRAEIPASNGHANARALARMYAMLVEGGEIDGVRLLDAATIRTATAERVSGIDAVLGAPTRFSLGFMLPNELRPFAPVRHAFGHPGAGGALAFADPEARLAFGYTPNRTVVTLSGADPRWTALVEAAYSCL
jgi:CubicO group peptidase (beta-lactamase class C family)